jgi:hypothetical protein
MLKPAIVALGIGWDRPAARREVFRQLDRLVAEFHPNDAQPGAENTFEMFIFRPEDLDLRNLLERELRIKINCAIHVAHRHAD